MRARVPGLILLHRRAASPTETANTTMATITKDTAVTITYKVTTPQGKPLDGGSLSYLHGGYENIFPKVEAALEGQAVGFSTALDLAVEDAFGARNGCNGLRPGTPGVRPAPATH